MKAELMGFAALDIDVSEKEWMLKILDMSLKGGAELLLTEMEKSTGRTSSATRWRWVQIKY